MQDVTNTDCSKKVMQMQQFVFWENMTRSTILLVLTTIFIQLVFDEVFEQPVLSISFQYKNCIKSPEFT